MKIINPTSKFLNFTHFILLLLSILPISNYASIADTNIVKSNNYPNCTKPSGIRILQFDSKKIEFSWEGIAAVKGGTYYQVRYQYSDENGLYPWRSDNVYSGRWHSIDLISTKAEIEIQVRKMCFDHQTKEYFSSEWVEVIKVPINNNAKRDLIYDAEECDWIKEALLVKMPDNSYQLTVSYNAGAVHNPAIYTNPYWRLMVSYKSCNSNANQQEKFSASLADSIFQFLPSSYGICEMTVRIVWDGTSGSDYKSWCEWHDVIINSNNNPPSGPPCGSGTPFNPTNSNPLLIGAPGQIWKVSGIPFTITTVSGSNGVFTGTGELIFPINSIFLKVQFNNIHVNELKEVIDGSVDGIPGIMTCYKTGTNLGSTSDMCKPKSRGEGWNPDGTYGPSGLSTDPFGFDVNGHMTKNPPHPYEGFKEGDPYDENYDPNGFDANGNHRETGTKYDPFGCNREGRDSLGNKCDPSGGRGPYYWVNGSGGSEEGLALSNKESDSLKLNIEIILTDLGDQVDIIRSGLNCNQFRTIIDQNMANSSHAKLIKGPDDEYYKEEMSKNFSSAPIKNVTKSQRRVGQQALEDAHVDLYNCDVKDLDLKEVIQYIEGMKGSPNIEELMTEIKNRMKNLSKDYAKQLLDDHDAFLAWLQTILKGEVNQFKSGTFTNHEIPFNNEFDYNPFAPNKKIYEQNFVTNYSASLSDEQLSTKNLDTELNYQLQQGWQEVLGKHRALWYDDAIHKNQVVFIGECTNTTQVEPVVLTKEIAGKEEHIYFDNIKLGPNQGSCNIYYVLTIPKTGEKYVFSAENVGISNGGLLTDIKLRINNDVSFRINNSTSMKLKGTDPGTYVQFNCQGLKEIGIVAEVEFCREFLTPVDPTSKQIITDPASKVKGYINTVVGSWGDLFLTISMDPFALTKNQDVKWELTAATLDFSDTRSPSFKFPTDYGSAFMDNSGGPSPQWTGVYIQSISATLPNKFSKGNNPITVNAQEIIFDAMGFTGSVRAYPVLAMGDGNIGGWGVSIDTFSLSFMHNSLTGGSMAGLINIPTFDENLKYSAKIHENDNYEFKVITQGQLTANLWAAKVILESNSSISVSNQGSEFTIAANLNGMITVDGKLGSLNFKVPDIKFQDVIIGNKDPYFSPGVWSCTGSAGIKVGGFEITASRINLFKGETNDETKLGLDVKISLTNADAGSIGAEARMHVIGKMEPAGEIQKWVFSKIAMSGITINADIKGNSIKGSLIFFDINENPSFGTGFKGSLDAVFKGVGEMTVFATFGQFPTYKYFFVDAMVKLDHPIPMGALGMHGFGGGLYNHMTRAKAEALNGDHYSGGTRPAGSAPSGVSYVPDPNAGLGFRATVALSATVRESFNCDITFEMNFNAGGGIATVRMEGNGRFMDKLNFGNSPHINPGGKPNSASMCANVGLDYDFNKQVFSGSLEVFANVGGILKGAGTGDKVVDAKILVEKAKWYILIGTPAEPCGFIFSIPGIGQIAKSASYLDIGTDIPPMSSLESRGITGLAVDAPTGRQSGTGFAFGSSIELGTSEKEFAIFYAKLKLNFGFDLMVGKYSNTFCQNGGSSSELGINGWYAQGQAWAKVEAGVGIKVKVWGKKKRYDIFDVNGYVALKAKLPNPFYAAGILHGEYKILNGLVKGKCNFKFEIGEQCNVANGGGALDDLNFITNIDPEDKKQAVECNAVTQADFLFSIDKITYVDNENDPNVKDKFVANLKKYSVKSSSGDIIGLLIPGNDKQSYRFKPKQLYPAYDSVTVEVTVDIYKNGNFDETETKRIGFKTGGLPEEILDGNILESYPMANMEYFYQKEFQDGKGYIILDIGQPDLFVGAAENDIVARFKSAGQTILTASKYDFANNQLDFTIPNLPHGEDCVLEVVDMRKKPSGDNGTGGASGQNYPSTGKVLTSLKFHVSNYDRFKDKMTAYISASSYSKNENYDHTIISSINEKWGNDEINDYIHSVTNVEDNNFFMTKAINQLYKRTYANGECESQAMRNFHDQTEFPIFTTKLTNSSVEWKLGTAINIDYIKFIQLINLYSIEWNQNLEPNQKSTLNYPKICPNEHKFMDSEEAFKLSGNVRSIFTYKLPVKPAFSKVKVDFLNRTVN